MPEVRRHGVEQRGLCVKDLVLTRELVLIPLLIDGLRSSICFSTIGISRLLTPRSTSDSTRFFEDEPWGSISCMNHLPSPAATCAAIPTTRRGRSMRLWPQAVGVSLTDGVVLIVGATMTPWQVLKVAPAGNFRARNRCLDHDRPRANLDQLIRSTDVPLHRQLRDECGSWRRIRGTVTQLIRLEHESRDCLDPCPAPAGGAQRLLQRPRGITGSSTRLRSTSRQTSTSSNDGGRPRSLGTSHGLCLPPQRYPRAGLE